MTTTSTRNETEAGINEDATELADHLDDQALRHLSSFNETAGAAQFTVGDTTVKVASLSALRAGGASNQSGVSIGVEGSAVAVHIPAAAAENFGDSAVVVLQLLSDDFTASLLPNRSASSTKEVEAPQPVLKAVLEFSVFPSSSHNTSVTGSLPEPVRLAMPVNASGGAEPEDPEPGVSYDFVCRYWDKEGGTWSTKGLQTEIVEGQVVCITTHFSLFAVFVEALLATLECSNVEFLTPQALHTAVVHVGEWWHRPAANLLYLVTVLHLFLMLFSLEVDCSRRNSRGKKTRVLQLKKVEAIVGRSASLKEKILEAYGQLILGLRGIGILRKCFKRQPQEEAEETEPAKPKVPMSQKVLLMLRKLEFKIVDHCSTLVAANLANLPVGEFKMARKKVKEYKQHVEKVQAEVEDGAAGDAVMQKFVYVNTQMVKRVSSKDRRVSSKCSAGSQESGDGAADRRSFGRASSKSSSSSTLSMSYLSEASHLSQTSNTSAWKRRNGPRDLRDLNAHLVSCLDDATQMLLSDDTKFQHRWMELFAALHPWSMAGVDSQISHTFVLSYCRFVTDLGAFTASAMFFSASDTTAGPGSDPTCDPGSGLKAFLQRAFIGIFSDMIKGVPVAALAYLLMHGRVVEPEAVDKTQMGRRVKDVVVVLLGLAYGVFCCVFLLSFIANTSVGTSNAWMEASVSTFLSVHFLSPLTTACWMAVLLQFMPQKDELLRELFAVRHDEDKFWTTAQLLEEHLEEAKRLSETSLPEDGPAPWASGTSDVVPATPPPESSADGEDQVTLGFSAEPTEEAFDLDEELAAQEARSSVDFCDDGGVGDKKAARCEDELPDVPSEGQLEYASGGKLLYANRVLKGYLDAPVQFSRV